MAYKVEIGEEFELVDVSFDKGTIHSADDDEKAHRRSMQKMLAYVFLVMFGAFLTGAAIIGWLGNDYDGLYAVWAVGAAPFGAIMKTFFGSWS